MVGRGGSTLGVFSDSESPEPAQPIVPLSSATGPSPWDQTEEVAQLSDKPPSPPRPPSRRTPEFKVPFPPAPRRVASGSSFVGWGAGRSVVPGEGWKAVSPMRKLVYGVQRQLVESVRRNRNVPMQEVKDKSKKLWGRNPVGIDGDLRQQLTDVLWEVRDRRGIYQLPFHSVFRREYHQTTKESMATPPLLKRMIGSIVDIGTIERNYRSTATVPETGMELPVKVGEE